MLILRIKFSEQQPAETGGQAGIKQLCKSNFYPTPDPSPLKTQLEFRKGVGSSQMRVETSIYNPNNLARVQLLINEQMMGPFHGFYC